MQNSDLETIQRLSNIQVQALKAEKLTFVTLGGGDGGGCGGASCP